MAKPAVIHYRLWCGQKKHCGWRADRLQVWQIAIDKGLAYENPDGSANLGPLTWIEVGERSRPKGKTVRTAPDRR